jgi:hypothetical protein
MRKPQDKILDQLKRIRQEFEKLSDFSVFEEEPMDLRLFGMTPDEVEAWKNQEPDFHPANKRPPDKLPVYPIGGVGSDHSLARPLFRHEPLGVESYALAHTVFGKGLV